MARALRCLVLASTLALSLCSTAVAQDLILNGTTMTLGGTHRYRRVELTNGARIVVPPFDGTWTPDRDDETTGQLVLIAEEISIDATSSIDARGAGYQTPRCGDGAGPGAGQGGCAVRDSGGGGAHFGRGGRGTKDCFVFGSTTSCQFPQEYEEDCVSSLAGDGLSCTTSSDCRNNDGLPSVAGVGYFHHVYFPELGSSGGDKGCRDGDGFGSQPRTGGAGGGRIVLVGLRDDGTGTIDIQGTVTTHGRRGCGAGNDSGGGGAGGSILVVGDSVQVGPDALVTAGGGLGGDTRSGAVGQPDQQDCVGAQAGGTCDDCGGGGGGGIIAVLSRASAFDYGARFDVAGADGGTCDICRGEAGGGAGELQLDGAYVGELCDGYDNDFDGATDEDLGEVDCGLGACAARIGACTAGSPTTCAPGTTESSCFAPRDEARPRVAVILDTSASMLLDLAGYPTFGDGSVERPGLDTDGDSQPNDSRLFLARESLASVISAYPEIDFALARYHADQAVARSCQTAAWFECAGLVGTYDDPRDNSGATICTVQTSATTSQVVREISTAGDECINYAGSCGAPRRGADVLSGFGTPTRDLVRWLDGRETGFRDDITPGDVCDHVGGGDCEVRGTGPTPLAGSLQAIEDYVVPIRTTDPQRACRGYTVILVTDGAESCNGDPVAAAASLYATHGIETYVIAVSVLASEEASLNAIAVAGSGGGRTTATFVRRPEDLVPALTSIIEGSIRFEVCNTTDDDCDGAIDEGFALGRACDDGLAGICRGTGAHVCTADGLSTECSITMPGAAAGTEECNAMDDDCDEAIDEGLTCTGMCTPTGPEVCNGVDDDCNGLVDEFDPAVGMPCGSDAGICTPGTTRCVAGMLTCLGGTGPLPEETCDGEDDDCDDVIDEMAECPAGSTCIEGACRRDCDPSIEFPCPPGFECVVPEGETRGSCLPTPCASCAPGEVCRDGACVDPCDGVSCDPGLTCVRGECVDCHVTGCAAGQVCFASECRTDPCVGVRCADTEACVDGACTTACGEGDCPAGQRCAADGSCESDPCAGVECGSGRFCDDGECRMDPCRGMSCPRGDVCAPERGCIDDPCALVHCPEGRTCGVRRDGTAECRRGEPPMGDAGVEPEDRRVIAAGGGLCAASPSSSGAPSTPLVVALATLALGLARRRARGGAR